MSYDVLKKQFSCLDLQPLSDWITGMTHKPIYLLFGSTTLEKPLQRMGLSSLVNKAVKIRSRKCPSGKNVT